MARLFHLDFVSFWHRWCYRILAIVWAAGLLLGLGLFLRAGDPAASLMRSASLAPVSIVRLLFAVSFPFLVTASAVYLSGPWLLLPLCFLRAAVFSFVSLGICRVCGSGVRFLPWLLLFSQFLSAPLYYWYLRHYISGERPFHLWVAFTVLCLILLLGSIDSCVISPFLVNLIDFMKG